jgi:hypothetical protein
VLRRSDASLQLTWTPEGAAFWGWASGRSVPGDQLRRVAGEVLGSWWAGREATLEPIVVTIPDHDILHASALVAPPRVVVDLMADRYPSSSWSASMRWLHASASLAIDAAVAGLVLPTLETTGLRWRAGWELIDHGDIEDRIERLAETMPPVVIASSPSDAREVIDRLADAACRRGLAQSGWKPPLPRSRTAHIVATRRVTTALADGGGIVVGDNERHEATFAELSAGMSEIRSIAEGSTPLTSRGRLEPGDEDQPWELRFEVVSLDDPTKAVGWQEVFDATPSARDLIDGRSLAPVRRYVRDLTLRLAALVPGLDQLDDQPGHGSIDLELDDVALLLMDGLELCDRSGAPILVPKGLVRRRLRLTASATPAETGGVSAHLGESLVDVDWGLALGDEALTERELRDLAEAQSGLVQLRGEWVRVDTAETRSALQELADRREDQGSLTPAELLRTAAEALAKGEVDLAAAPSGDNASAGGWLRDLLSGLPDDELREVVEPDLFMGELRPYQRRAVGWMQFLARLGLGGCLADDMGLGKTPTTLAHILGRAGSKPALVLCPLSVVHNWESETARFTPTLRVFVAHGPSRPTGDQLLAVVAQADIVITTYGTATRDVETLARIEWGLVVCDEAQAIKNHHTNAARAVRQLDSRQTLALTGTPVENRLSELWAILDAVNPGMVGGITWFRERFATPIEQHNDEEALDGMRRLTGPFVLRRTKADKSLVPDLPDKVEQVAWATLTQEQAGLYRAVLDDFLAEAEQEDGMKRRGLVLATLTRLKQICNHPAQFLADGSTVAGRSGKLERFDGLVDELLDAGERALVFTQYRAMGELLADHLGDRLDRRPDFLHGGVSRGRRQSMIDDFQSGDGPPLFLISLKAGGTGLNLTAASRVIHYDRWWNPAVEDQATDRAWRIGQTQTVFVHKLVCQGTLEERIDGLLAQKKDLADRAVGAGEGWLTEMTTDQLRAVLSLDPVAAED